MRRYWRDNIEPAVLVVLLVLFWWFLGTAAPGGPPKAPLPPVKFTTATTSAAAKDTLTLTTTVKPSNLPTGAVARWQIDVVPLRLLVYFDGEIYVIPYTGPGPNPNPNPNPDPLPVPTELWAIVVEESAERTPEQGIVLASPKVRSLFSKDGFRLIDDDSTVGSDLQPYLDRAKGQKLPVCFLVDSKGTVYWEGPLPATIPAMEALVAKFRKGGAK